MKVAQLILTSIHKPCQKRRYVILVFAHSQSLSTLSCPQTWDNTLSNAPLFLCEYVQSHYSYSLSMDFGLLGYDLVVAEIQASPQILSDSEVVAE